MNNTADKHWTDWLEDISPQQIYLAEKYVARDPSDFSCARIPDLKTTINNLPALITANIDKADLLAKSFFPLPPAIPHVPPDHDYPEHVTRLRFFSRQQIKDAI